MSETMDLITVRAMCLNGEARRIREASNLSQPEVAAEVGECSPVAVSRWERGERLPRGDAALRYLKTLRRLQRATAGRTHPVGA